MAKSRIVCIKIGGSLMDEPGFFSIFAEAIQRMPPRFLPIVIHGGGKEISRQLDLLKKEAVFVEGMRVTDAQSMDVVQMVLSGSVNKRIVNALETGGINAVGLSGVDAGLLTASKLLINGKDVGMVGKIDSVNPRILACFIKNNIVPVISPVSRDSKGEIYNVNADLVASEIAVAVKAAHLIFVSDVVGVMVQGSIIKNLSPVDIRNYIDLEIITGGMIPKVRSAAEAVKRGVEHVHICGWQAQKTFANELNEAVAAGTRISKK
ncbi:MAG: acetylglutamate kinase [Chitinivibrionales bacterium]|nr:acetylglutamate kinase [Chitinivibrionales bacterium]